MEKYIKPEIQFKKFELEDIITTSSGGSIKPNIDGGSTTYLEEWINSWFESQED